MRLLKFIGTISICFFAASGMYAQSSKDFGTTEKTSLNPKNKHSHKEHKGKRLARWIKKDSKGLLMGNACMDDVIHDMGFEYVIQTKDQPCNRHGFGKFINNLGVKTIILFKNGPFWKFKLKRKRKECLRLTGDHLG